MTVRMFLGGAILAALLQLYAAAGFIFERATLLRTGQEVVLNTGFIDPRDLFRGHYVTLPLTIEDVELSELSSFDEIGSYEDVYVELVEGEDGFWVADRLTAHYPDAPEGPVIKAKVSWMGIENANGQEIVRIDYPIDRYFAPKLEAKRLEDLRDDRKLGVIVALDDQGNAGIKGLTIDGEKVYDEPLF